MFVFCRNGKAFLLRRTLGARGQTRRLAEAVDGIIWVGQFSGRPKDSLRRPRNGTQFLTDLSV
jgi:hypothetical protein